MLGAFAAHGLKTVLTENLLNTWKTAVLYQFIHVFLILFMSCGRLNRLRTFSLLFAFAGIILFSGSLYLYCLTEIKYLAFITPIGGTFFIAAWILAAFCVLKEPKLT